MSIEITEFADVDIAISPTGVQLGEFGILGFLTNEAGILPVERARSYGSLNEVVADWSTNTEVYKAAVAFYGQTPSPKDFTVVSVYETAQPATILGGDSSTVADFATPLIDTITTSIGGTEVTTTVDFNGVASESAVAAAVTAAIVADGVNATVTWDGASYVFTTDLTGSTITVDFCSGVVGEALGLTQAFGTISQGLDPETPVAALTDLSQKNFDITALVTHKKFRDEVSNPGSNTEDIADLCEALKIIFMNTTNNLATVQSGITSDVGSVLVNKALRFTHTTLAKNPNQYPSASVFGRAASVNFEGLGTTITLNLKQAPTISAEDFTTGELEVLRTKRVNVVIQIGKSAQGFTDSRMANGSWLDSVHGLLWLENRIEVDLFNLLYTTNTKVPYTQDGLNLVINTVRRSLEQGVLNGLLAPGFAPDGTFVPDGYIVTATDIGEVSSSDRTNRIYRGITFTAIGAGALHKVLVNGSFSE